MGNADAYLIPGRFTLTLGHLVAVLVLYYYMDENVASGLPKNASSAQEKTAMQSLRGAWTLALCCFVFDMVGMLGGLSIFFKSFNLVQSVLHFFGALYTCWFILNAWNYHVFWKICGLFNVVPALLELAVILNIFMFKSIPY